MHHAPHVRAIEAVRTLPLAARPRLLMADFATHGIPLRPSRERWQLACWTLHLFRYAVVLEHAGRRFHVRAGDATLFPPHAEVVFHHHGRGTHAYCHFELGAAGAPPAREAPAHQRLGPRFGAAMGAMEVVIAHAGNDRLRAEVALWDLLLGLCRAGRTEPGGAAGDQPLHVRAIQLIEAQLGEALAVAELASACGVGRNHLARIFRRQTGRTINQFIRTRRAERAARLLASTDLPLRAIAREVGLSTAQAFNKLMRATVGAGPRQIRAAARGDNAGGLRSRLADLLLDVR